MTDNALPPEVSLAGRLQDLVLESPDIISFLTDLTHAASDRLSSPGEEVLCGVTLLRSRVKATVAGNGERARKMDEVQYSSDDGPCRRAAREGRTVYVPDLRTEERFCEATKAISGHGLISTLGVPVPLDGDASAGLNLYASIQDAFDIEDIPAAEDFAREASRSLRMAVRIAHLTDTGNHLRSAMASRTTIDLAVGIIMGQNKCSQDTAMSILKAASSARNTKLREVAASVLASVDQQPPGSHFDG